MTYNFDNFIKTVIREMAFKDIPDKRPYGFWLSPGLQLFIVPYEGHSKIASELVFKNKKLKIGYENINKYTETDFDFVSPMEYLSSINFIRIVFDSKFGHNQKLYFMGNPSHKQQLLIKDLGMFYETPIVKDNQEMRSKRVMGIYEEFSFAKLPDSGFYGLWVLPNGSFEIVQNYGKHDLIAKQTILNNPVLEQRFMEYIGRNDSVDHISSFEFFDWFYKVYGAVRMVKAHKCFLYSFAKPITDKCKKTIKDLSEYYNIFAEGESDIAGNELLSNK